MHDIKPFLLLQLRPEDEVADNEAEAFMKFGGLEAAQVHRVRMEKTGIPPIKLTDYSGVIVGGGPSNVSDSENVKPPEQKRFEAELYELLDEIIAADFPYLGTCYGIGTLARFLGGRVSKERYGESAEAITVNLTEEARDDPLTKDLPQSFRAFAGHKESCQELPPGATLLASSPGCPIHMIRVKQNIYASQFHTELDKEGLALRIKFYKHLGYFPPEEAEMLIAAAEHEEITVPGTILRRFIMRYSKPAAN